MISQTLGRKWNMRSQYNLWLALIVMVSSTQADENLHREQDQHQHGRGLLNIVVQDKILALSLEIPAINVVGFEHEPHSPAEQEIVDRALNTFAEGKTIFAVDEAASCQLVRHNASLGNVRSTHPHGSSEIQDDNPEEAHSELHVEYEFHCEQPQEIQRIGTTIFTRLPHLEILEVQVVTARTQKRLHLDPEDPTFSLTPD